MKKLKYCVWRFKLWNRWSKKTTNYSAWEKFLVLIGKKMSVSFYGLMMAESMMEGVREAGKAAKEASDSMKKLEQAIKDKLNVVSPSGHRYEPKRTLADNLDGYKVQMSVYDEIHRASNNQNPQPKS